MPSETTPLLQDHARNFWVFNDQSADDYHEQFCKLIGIPPSDLGPKDVQPVPPKSLYGRALQIKKSQQRTYAFTAAISNSLLLSQVVLGAAVTALGASESSHVLITLFGALNTIIAGVVAYLKSRGQPMRARMFRDDLERVVDEIENSEIMWRDMKTGISKNMHGYDDIDVDASVTVRSEVARLTRLYERAVRTNTVNNPDMYQGDGGTIAPGAALKLHQNPTVAPAAPIDQAAAVPAPATVPVPDPDDSPATSVPQPKKDQPKDDQPAPEAESSKPKDDPNGTNPTVLPNSSSATTDSKGKSPASE